MNVKWIVLQKLEEIEAQGLCCLPNNTNSCTCHTRYSDFMCCPGWYEDPGDEESQQNTPQCVPFWQDSQDEPRRYKKEK